MQHIVDGLVSSPQTLRVMQQTVSIVPNLGIAHLYLSKCYLHQKNPHAARESYNQAVKLDLKLKDIGYWIDIQDSFCELFISEKAFDKAIAIYENVLKELEGEKDKQFLISYYKPRIHSSLAEVYHKQGDLDKSIETYKKAIDIAEDDKPVFGFSSHETIKIHRSLAKVYREKGNDQEARHHEKVAASLERKQNLFIEVFSSGVTAFFAGIAQFFLLVVIVLFFLIRILKSKKSQDTQGISIRKIFWDFRTTALVYFKSFFLPLFFIVLLFAVIHLSLSLLGSSSVFIVPCIVVFVSAIIYFSCSGKRFKQRFNNIFPDVPFTAHEKNRAILTLTLWEFLWVGIINVIFLFAGYIAVIALIFVFRDTL